MQVMKSSNFLLLCFVFCSGCCCSSHSLPLSSPSNSTKLCSRAQSLSLLHLKNSFSNENPSYWYDCHNNYSYPKTDSWKEGSDCCSWDGVKCDPVTSYVIDLDLSCSRLSGTIHRNSTLFSLSPRLRKLNLAFNDFTGSSVSDGFGRFPSLTHLNLSASGFSGLISPQLSHLSNLVSLDLSWNDEAKFVTPYAFESLVQNLTKLQKLHLGGTYIPSPVNFLDFLLLNRSSLMSLDLCNCRLYGRFPDHDIHLPNLQLLSLSGNYNLSGSFPRFSVNNSLKELDLSHTNFNGELPTSIGDLKSLQTLDLSSCEFSGSIPTSIGNLKSLQSLFLSRCVFSGSIPDTLENLTQITDLDLRDNHFSGEIPNVFYNLAKLVSLHLSGNDFSGELPTSIGNLKSLQTLHLFRCEFSGSIPHTLENLTQITDLDLNNNHFSGEIPNVFYNLADLVSLYLFENNFSGRLPPSIWNLTKLLWLDLSNNQLEGVIPCSHGNGFPSLDYVNFGYNMLNGTIPPCLYTLPSLRVLDLSHNKFTGPIGDCQSYSLEIIDLSRNELEGLIPSSIFELVNLTRLSLSSNHLSGMFETNQFKKLTHLDLSNNMLSFTLMSNNSNSSMLPVIEVVDLSDNNISGIWTWNLGSDRLDYLNLSYNSISGIYMFPWTNLGILDLRSNLLQGPLPIPPISLFFFSVSHNKLIGEISPLICQASSIEFLDLSYNNFSGMLPHCLGKFSQKLSVLNLRRNRFHGVIPHTFSQGNAIRTLDFNDNQLEGPVPRSLIICRELEVLDLGNNMINDTFPHWLTTLPKLQVLVLRSNHFHGDIISLSKFMKSPFASLQILDLAHNDFKGNLPGPYLTSLKSIININESSMTRKYIGDKNNYYQDSITVTMKGFEFDLVKILETFTIIDLSCNKFQGQIPECIGDLNSLRGLNLSHNRLTGHIPLSFKNLKMLESLDLSSNKLSGMIPQELTSVTFLEVLNLSYNDLIGVIPRGNQFDTFGNDSYIENSRLCGFPLSKGCITTADILDHSQERGEDQFDLRSAIFMGYGCGIVIGLSLSCIIFMSGKPKWLVWIIDKKIFNYTTRYKRSCGEGAGRS